MNKKQVLFGLFLLLLFGPFGSSHAATIFSEDFNSITPAGTILPIDKYSEKWSLTNYFIDGPPSLSGWAFGGQALLAQNGNNLGDKAILLNEAPHGSMLSKQITVSSGTSYLLTFDYWGDNRTGTPYKFAVQIGSQPGTEYGGLWYSPSGSWNTKTIPFTATSDTIVLSFLDESSGEASPIIDNIKVSSVPIPSAIWLLGAGLLGLVGIRRKIVK
jgi:hypothetical protein